MTGNELNYPHIIMITGIVIVLIMLLKSGIEPLGIPALVGYLLLGLMLRAAGDLWSILDRGPMEIIMFMAKLGLVTLLFKVGLESNLRGLVAQLRRASLVWVSNLIVCGAAGFTAAYSILGFTLETSLIVATALTATSVGISVALWQRKGALDTEDGEILIDIAELDDLSAVVLMAMLFPILDAMNSGNGSVPVSVIFGTAGFFFIKLVFFGTLCFLFSRYLEKPVTRFFKRLESGPDPMLVMVGISMVIAALASFLGFSLAIGAFFAGLLFSRDENAVKMENSFEPLYELFSPFFFIGIGLAMNPRTMISAAGYGVILFVVAAAGKLVAVGIPVSLMSGTWSGLLIGTSMIPRAEIAMIIMSRGLHSEKYHVPGDIYGAMVLVSALTCILSPLFVNRMLDRKRPGGES